MMNLSSTHDDWLVQSNLSSIFFQPQDFNCHMSGPSSVVFTAFIVIYIFLLVPLCVTILYHGFKKRRQTSFTFLVTTPCHSDCFIYHNVVIEIIGIFGCIVCRCAVSANNLNVSIIGSSMFSFTWYGEIFLHILTCLERYLAVVHPITYMGLRNEKGIRIRNITTACVWVLSIVLAGWLATTNTIIVDLCVLISSLTVISFCSISVLCALVHQGPGEQVEDRKRVDQFKQRAFFTIVSILGVLLLRLASNVVLELMYISTGHVNCIMFIFVMFFNLPSSSLLPLLFLNKERKLYFNRIN